MDKMELKKGYTPAELNAFMQEVFRSGRKAERTPDGGWRVISNVPKVDCSKRKVDSSKRKVDTSQEQPITQGVWNRFKSFFKSK